MCNFVRRTLYVALIAAALAAPKLNAQTTTYVGDAAALKANVAGILNVSLSDTGALPPTGGALSASLLNFQVPPTVDLHLLTAHTIGDNDQTNSQASVTDLTLNIAGVYITASVLTSNANALCYPSQADVNGSSAIVGLKVNGLAVKVTGKPNQTIPLLVGSLVINEQISQVTAPPEQVSSDIVVNALHLKVNLIADVVVSHSHAGTICAVHERQ